MIQAGRLRHRLKIKKPVEVRQTDGSLLRTWFTYATRWGNIRNETGRELLESDRPQDRTRCVISMRGMEELRESHLIEDGPFRYGIESIADRDELGAEVTVLCARRRLNCLTVNWRYVKAGGNYISIGEQEAG